MGRLVVWMLVALQYLPLSSGWGELGHETIAYIAQSYVSSTTKTQIQSILGSTASDYMASVSTWADSYRYTTPGKWSAPLHFIDANDNPPKSCSVNYDRDCDSSGCVVSAIVNYTSILMAGSSKVSKAELLDAMRFIIHFVGDIHQPLHDEALDVGGNDIDVTYDGDSTNLHHIWDTEIVEQLADGASAESFAKTLETAIKADSYGWDVSSWLTGTNIADSEGSAITWASQANAYVCSDVLKAGVSAVEQGDLSGSYYTAHVAVARTQIARAGYRLGAWLNLIFTGSAKG